MKDLSCSFVHDSLHSSDRIVLNHWLRISAIPNFRRKLQNIIFSELEANFVCTPWSIAIETILIEMKVPPVLVELAERVDGRCNGV